MDSQAVGVDRSHSMTPVEDPEDDFPTIAAYTIDGPTGQSIPKRQTDTESLTAVSHVLDEFQPECSMLAEITQLVFDKNVEELCKVLGETRDKNDGTLVQLMNAFDGEQMTVLHLAARYADASIINQLIAFGADVNKRGRDQLTPLHEAVKYSNMKKASRQVITSNPTSFNNNLSSAEPKIRNEEKKENWVEGLDHLRQLYADERRNSSSTAATFQIESDDSNDDDIGDLTFISANSATEILMMKGADVNLKDVFGMTPLHYAAMKGGLQAMLCLLKDEKIDKEARDKQNMTPLHLAVSNGRLGCFRALIAEGANSRVQDHCNTTLLHCAAATGNVMIVTEMLQEDRSLVNADDSEGLKPLHHAVANGHLSVCSILLLAGADIRAQTKALVRPLHLAAQVGDTKLIELLLQHRHFIDSADKQGRTPLHYAAAHDRLAAAKTLLDHNARPDYLDREQMTPALVAARQGNSAVLGTLVSRGASLRALDHKRRTCVFWCAANNSTDALKLVLRRQVGRDLVDVRDISLNAPLHEASRLGHIEVAEQLLNAGASVSRKNQDGATPLHVAAKEGQIAIINLLVAMSLDLLETVTEDGDTALHLAARQGHAGALRALMSRGAQPEAQNVDGRTPLSAAAQNGHADCCDDLIHAGAPVFTKDKSGRTPLHLAARWGHVEVVKLLLANEARLSDQDITGKNPLELAMEYAKRDVVTEMARSNQVVEALAKVSTDPKGHRITPLRTLIKAFPDVIESVLDKLVTTNDKPVDHPDYTIKVQFDLLDDTYTTTTGSEGKGEEAGEKPQGHSTYPTTYDPPYNNDGTLVKNSKVYSTDLRLVRRNHPLRLLARHHPSLLAHPAVSALLDHKWTSYTRYFYYLNLFVYLVFLISLTLYVIAAMQLEQAMESYYNTKYSEQQQQAAASVVDDLPPKDGYGQEFLPHITNIVKAHELRRKEGYRCKLPPKLTEGEPSVVGCSVWLMNVSMGFTVVTSILLLCREGVQFIQSKLSYTGNLINILEIASYMMAILLVVNFDGYYCRQEWQWAIAAVVIFFSWMILIMLIRKLPLFGIYVVMFTDVLATFSRFFGVFVLFIFAFALSFMIVFREHAAFAGPLQSVLKTTVMMIGELEYDSIFSSDSTSIKYAYVTYPLFMVFLIFMPIIIMTLLVGLAVDDIKAVQDQAWINKMAMKTKLVLEVECVIPDRIRRHYSVSFKKLHPYQKTKFGWILKGFKPSEFFSMDDNIDDMQPMDETLRDVISRLHTITKEQKNLQQLVQHAQLSYKHYAKGAQI